MAISLWVYHLVEGFCSLNSLIALNVALFIAIDLILLDLTIRVNLLVPVLW